MLDCKTAWLSHECSSWESFIACNTMDVVFVYYRCGQDGGFEVAIVSNVFGTPEKIPGWDDMVETFGDLSVEMRHNQVRDYYVLQLDEISYVSFMMLFGVSC